MSEFRENLADINKSRKIAKISETSHPISTKLSQCLISYLRRIFRIIILQKSEILKIAVQSCKNVNPMKH